MAKGYHSESTDINLEETPGFHLLRALLAQRVTHTVRQLRRPSSPAEQTALFRHSSDSLRVRFQSAEIEGVIALLLGT